MFHRHPDRPACVGEAGCASIPCYVLSFVAGAALASSSFSTFAQNLTFRQSGLPSRGRQLPRRSKKHNKNGITDTVIGAFFHGWRSLREGCHFSCLRRIESWNRDLPGPDYRGGRRLAPAMLARVRTVGRIAGRDEENAVETSCSERTRIGKPFCAVGHVSKNILPRLHLQRQNPPPVFPTFHRHPMPACEIPRHRKLRSCWKVKAEQDLLTGDIYHVVLDPDTPLASGLTVRVMKGIAGDEKIRQSPEEKLPSGTYPIVLGGRLGCFRPYCSKAQVVLHNNS